MKHGYNSNLLRGWNLLWLLALAFSAGQVGAVDKFTQITHTVRPYDGGGDYEFIIVEDYVWTLPTPGSYSSVRYMWSYAVSPKNMNGVGIDGNNATVSVRYSTNGGATYYNSPDGSKPAGSPAGPFWVGPNYVAPTNIYCTTPMVCNSGLYTRQYHFKADASGGFSSSMYISPALPPGGCYTFPQVCTDDKSKLSMSYSDFQQTDGGFTNVATGTVSGDSLAGWSTNTSIPTPGALATGTNSIGPTTPNFVGGATGNTNITFSTNATPADSGSLQSGFNALYKATVDGFESTKSTLNAGFGKLSTNILAGNGINQAGFNNLSNLAATGNNTLKGISNGIYGLTPEQNSNNIVGIRSNTSNTVELLRSVTNLLGSLGTNGSGTNSGITSGTADTWRDAGIAAAGDGKDDIDGLKSQMPANAGTAPTDVGNWVIGAGSWSFDLNPTTGTWAGVASMCRTFILWLATVCYVAFCCKLTMEAMYASTAAKQASSAATTPIASTGVALIMAAAMTVALAAVPALLVVTLGGGLFSIIGVSPWAGATGGVAMGVAVANAFIPLDAVLTYLLLGVTFRFALGSTFWVSTTVVRFLVGCAVLFVGLAGSYGDWQWNEVTIQNGTSVSCYYKTGTASNMCIAPGSTFVLREGAVETSGTCDLQVRDSIGSFTAVNTAGLAHDETGLHVGLYHEEVGGGFVSRASEYATTWDRFKEGFVWVWPFVGFALLLRIVTNIKRQSVEV